MNDPTIKEFLDLTLELVVGLNEVFCSNSNCKARFLNIQQGQTSLRPRLGVDCGLNPNNAIVNFEINMKTVARRISKLKKVLDSKMSNCRSISGHRVTPGAFTRGKYHNMTVVLIVFYNIDFKNDLFISTLTLSTF